MARQDINVKLDTETREYYTVWEPVFIGAGQTRQDALADLRAAVHFGVETLLNPELENINTNKED